MVVERHNTEHVHYIRIKRKRRISEAYCYTYLRPLLSFIYLFTFFFFVSYGGIGKNYWHLKKHTNAHFSVLYRNSFVDG